MMNNFQHYSGISPETIHKLSMKIKDLNREHAMISDLLKEIYNYLSKVDLLNKELVENQNLFRIIDKDCYLKNHLQRSFEAIRFLHNWLEEIEGVSSEGINNSFEQLDDLILESLKLIEDKLKLEKSFSQNQSDNKS